MKICFITAFVFFTIFSTSFVFADDDETQFMFEFKENGIMPAFDEYGDIDTISEHLNVYRADYDTVMRLKKDGLIDRVEEDVHVQLADASSDYMDIYNDTYFSTQWYFDKHRIREAKKILGTGKGVRIAVIDSGVTIQKDFNPENIEKGYNYIYPEKTGNEIMESDGYTAKNHGTWVASIICSQSNNNFGIAGIAEDSIIVPLIIHQDEKAPVSNVIKAIDEAVRIYNCDVINMSITCSANPYNLQKVIDYANENNLIVIAAAGNDGKDPVKGKEYLYPASCENVISVGSIDSDFSKSDFSQTNDYVDIAAAGNNMTLVGSDGIYISGKGGTSFASPVVSGFAALLKEKYPDMNYEMFFSALKAGSLDISDTGYDIYSGFGAFDAMESVKFLEENSDFFISPVYADDLGFKVKVFGYGLYGSLVFAVYDDSGKMKYIDMEELIAEDDVFWKNIRYSPQEGEKIKIFAFDFMDTIMPLGKARVFTGAS